MKIFKLSYGLVAATLLLASSDINKYPELDDANAFVAFQSSTAAVGEEDGSVEIPVLLTSKSGMSATAEIEVVADETGTGAVEGTHFTIENKTLSFSGLDGAIQKIKINVVDNDVFGGNKSFTIRLKEGGSVNLGAAKTCKVTIQDDEHPLAFILGTYTSQVVVTLIGISQSVVMKVILQRYGLVILILILHLMDITLPITTIYSMVL